MRTVDHFVHGRGLVWNTGFRVAAYTHPLWLFVVAGFYAVVRTPFLALLLPSLLATFASVLVLARSVSRTPMQAVLASLALAASRAFDDFGTSGLENPLEHLGLALFVASTLDRSASAPRNMALAFGMLSVTRHDAVLLVSPCLAWTIGSIARDRSRRAEALGLAVLAITPLAAWTLFSLVYYGVPLPNTAYAKLFAGFPRQTIFGMTRRYVEAHFESEPYTLALAPLGILLSVLDPRPSRLTLGLGASLHLGYLAFAGGDFMLGRFLTPSCFVAALLVASSSERFGRMSLAVLPLLTAVAIAPSEWAPSRWRDAIGPQGIADEREHWGPGFRLEGNPAPITSLPNGPLIDPLRSLPEQADPHGANFGFIHSAGRYGFFAGPAYHFDDFWGIVDPYAARLPAMREVAPRPGHMLRFVAEGQKETIEGVLLGRGFHCRMADPTACALLEDTIVLAHDPLFSRARLRAFLRLNTGYYRGRLDADRYARPTLVRVAAASVASPRAPGTTWNAPPNVVFRDAGVDVVFLGPVTAAGLAIDADANDCLAIHVLSGREEEASFEVEAIDRSGLASRSIRFPAWLRDRSFDRVRIEPTCGDGRYALGSLRLIGSSSR